MSTKQFVTTLEYSYIHAVEGIQAARRVAAGYKRANHGRELIIEVYAFGRWIDEDGVKREYHLLSPNSTARMIGYGEEFSHLRFRITCLGGEIQALTPVNRDSAVKIKLIEVPIDRDAGKGLPDLL